MGMLKAKTIFWMTVVSVILSLMGMAIMKFSGPGPTEKSGAVTSDQRLQALEKAASGSPGMQRFLRNERAAEKANQDAADDLPR